MQRNCHNGGRLSVPDLLPSRSRGIVTRKTAAGFTRRYIIEVYELPGGTWTGVARVTGPYARDTALHKISSEDPGKTLDILVEEVLTDETKTRGKLGKRGPIISSRAHDR